MLFFGKNKKKKMSKIEKKELKKIKQAKKDLKQIKTKLFTTLSWMDLEKIDDDKIILNKNKKREFIKGIKLMPHNIFLDEPYEQSRIMEKIRLCYNKINCPMYFNFVFTPVNADDHIMNLTQQDTIEEDIECKKMIQSDFDKIYNFQNNFRELEFFVMIKNSDEKELEKHFYDLTIEFKNAGFSPKILNKRDYYNYLTFVFENPLINDYYFSRGIFSYLNQDIVYSEEKDEYEFIDTTEDFAKYDETLTPIINIKPDSDKVKNSKLAPTAFVLKNDKYIIGDKFVSNLLVTELPQVFWLGALCDYINNPNIKVFMTTSKLDMNISALLKKDYQEKQQELWKTRDPSLQQKLTNDLASLRDYIDQTIRNNDRTHNVTIVFSIYADDEKELSSIKKDLKQSLSAVGFKTTSVMLMQEMLLRTVCPLFIESKLPNTIRDNLGVPLPSDGLAGLYPFIFETLKDPKGFLMGHELQNGGIILYDTFYYLNNKYESQTTQRINANSIVVGMSGSGKTTTMNLVIRDFIKNKVRLIWVDPENKNASLTKKYGGTFVNWGQRNNIINVFDLKPVDTEDDEPNAEELMWDTERAIFNVIEDVCQIFSFLYPQIDEDILTIVGDVVIRSYNKVGISKQANGRYESFKGLSTTKMPTFTEFNTCVNEMIDEYKNIDGYKSTIELLNKLKLKMSRLMNEWSIYFNGHTTIKQSDNERAIISFGTKMLFNSPKNLREALNHIMFKYAWTQCLNDNELSAFVIDEAHTMILEGSTAKLVSQFFRRARKYKNAMVVGTQEPRDFADPSVLTDGKAIFNNATYKVCMLLKKDACNDLQKLVTLNENEKNLIQSFDQGEALFVCGDRRIPIKVIATEQELRDMGAM